MLKFGRLIKQCANLPSTNHCCQLAKSHQFVSYIQFKSFITFINLSDHSKPSQFSHIPSYPDSDDEEEDLEYFEMSNQQQQGQKKAKKAKKKKLSKAERIALRQQQQSKNNPSLKHPDDGNFGDLIFNQSQYKVQHHFPMRKIKKFLMICLLSLKCNRLTEFGQIYVIYQEI